MAAPVLAFPAPVFVADEGSIDFTATVTNAESVTSWSASGLATGASINTSTGQVTGTLSTPGQFQGTITATNGDGSFTVPIVIFVYSSTANISNTGAIQYLNTANRLYTLTENLTTPGTALAIIASNVAVDLAGYTITYNNATPISIANHSFETEDSIDGPTRAEGWDFSNIGSTGAVRHEGNWLYNEHSDGDYGMKFATATASGYIVSEDTITLEANTTYCLSAMFEYGGQGDTDNPGVKGYVQLVGTGSEDTREVFWQQTSWRGIQLVEATFTTGGSSETYNVRVGIVGHPSATKPFYIDDVRVTKFRSHGVVCSAPAWATASFPDVASFGNANDVIVTGGTITQGQDGGARSHGVYVQSQRTVLHDLTVTVDGNNCSCFWGQNMYSFPQTMTANTLASDATNLVSRDNFDGAICFGLTGTFAGNTILRGPHAGYYQSVGYASQIYNNDITLGESKYSNGFCIINPPSSHVFGNTIEGPRGIGLVGGTSGSPTLCYSNTITVEQPANSQEYQGLPLGGAYGIQLESTRYAEIYENTITALGVDAQGHALRIGPYGSYVPVDLEIHDNLLIADNQGNVASCLKLYGSAANPEYGDFDGINFYDNTFQTNDALIGGSGYCHIVLRGTHIEVIDPVATPYVFGYTNAVANNCSVTFLETTFEDSGSRDHFEAGEIRYENSGNVDTTQSMRVDLAWTTTINVEDVATDPLPDVLVTILDDEAATVFESTTDENGQYIAYVPEVTIIGTTTTTHGSYSANVAGDSESFTADQARTITLTATVAELPPEYVSGGSLTGDYDLLSGNIGSFNGYGYPTTYEWEIRDSEAGVHKSGTGSTFSEAGPHPVDTYSLYARATNAYGNSGWIEITSFEQTDDGVDPNVNYHGIVAQATVYDELNGSTIGTPQTGSGAYRAGGPWGHQLYDRDVGNYVNYGTVSVPTTGSLVAWVIQDATAVGTMTIATVRNCMALLASASSFNIDGFAYDGGFKNVTQYTTDNALHHAALVANGSTLKLYVDGIERHSIAFGNITANGTDILRMGSGWAATGHWDGGVGKFGWFDGIALTPEQIAELIAGPEPQNTVQPASPTGTTTEGETLTASDMGTWNNFGRTDGAVVNTVVRWERLPFGSEVWEPIADSAGTTYQATAADVNCHLAYIVRGTNLGGYIPGYDTRSVQTALIEAAASPGGGVGRSGLPRFGLDRHALTRHSISRFETAE